MSTDPSQARPNITSPQQQGTQVVGVTNPGLFLVAAFTLVLGVALGVANQGAGGTEMGLRVPALLAALLMVGQSVVDLRRNLPRRRVELVPEQGEPGSRGRELSVVRKMPPSPPVNVVTPRPTTSTLGVPIAVMVLAAWLGLADLRVEAPASLTALSLISAFALFALGWSLLPARR